MGSLFNHLIQPLDQSGRSLFLHANTNQYALIGSLLAALVLIPGAVLARGATSILNPIPPSSTSNGSSPSSASDPNENLPTQSQGITVESNSTSITSQDQANNHGSITINGNTEPLPQNGTFKKEMKSSGSNTKLDISVNNNSSNVESHSSTSIEVYSHSSSSQNTTEDPRSLPRR